MNKIYLLLTGISLCIYTFAGVPENKTLTGKITDKKTGEHLPGVSIYIPDLKTGAISDADGNYKIENLPQTRVLVQVVFIGYKLDAEIIDLSLTSTKDFALEESVNELNEIVVTGLSKAAEKNRTPSPISTVPNIQLLQNSSGNIIDALAKQPGVSQVTTGSGISKPVIRGLGYNRVVTVDDGIRQEGQQWGDEHGIEVDEYSVNKVEILKGPASLSYGSDAMAGVINMLTAPTLPAGKIQGSLLTNYQLNNGLFGYSANCTGNQKGFIWDLRYSNKMAHDYQNKYDGYVFNSGYRENTMGGIIGVNKSWGYMHLHLSLYNFQPGIIEGERDSLSGKFLKPIALNDSTESKSIAFGDDFTSYMPLVPYQKVHHIKTVLNNSFIIGQGSLKITAGWQQNRRQEFADILDPGQYGLYFLMNTANYDIRYLFPEKNNYSISAGVNGMYQASANKGTEFLIPEYHLFDIGSFIILKKTIHRLDLSGGFRFDRRDEHADDLFVNSRGEKINPDSSAFQQFHAFHSLFSGWSGSIGATYQFSENVFSKINLSRGFRAPNIAESGSNGVHDGTTRFEIGDPGLKPEHSWQLDYAFGLNLKHVTAEVDLFSNSIQDYIYTRKLESVTGGDSIQGGYSTYKYVSGDAMLNGAEFSIDIHPHPFDWLHFENSFSFVQSKQSNQPDSMKYLPFTPAPKISTEIRATLKKPYKCFSNAYVKAGVDNFLEQNHYFSAYGTETYTPAYTLINFGLGTSIVSKNTTLFSVFINIDNATDVAYQSHLSRLKYEAKNYLSGRTGVFNMGRNISFKLIVPVNIKS